MQPKRKAAADVFMEQNIQQTDSAPPPPNAAPGMQMPPVPGAPQPPPSRSRSPIAPQTLLKTSEELQLETGPIRVRETGFWPFKRIVVPPNVYVVHTRIGRTQPMTLGLGLSFSYNPYTDAYLIVPAAMQTIGIVANGISREKQGINILAYVQWQINDFAVAYQKLDFSDQRDPLGIVNAQLREQAEAAIKDKIATMSVEEVLTDKQPIIEELTERLKTVAEGRGPNGQNADEGLGIKIVTVQLKEALVSSQRLWEHLQAPFRYEQEKSARISYLSIQDEIREKELQTRRAAETSEAETLVEIERIKQSKQTEALQIRLGEENTRFTREQETVRQKIQLEEQTTLTRQSSEQRIQTQSAVAQQEIRLATLRRSQEEAIERTRLDADAGARQKALQVEQALRDIVEETRLAESRVQAATQQLERDATLSHQESENKLAAQTQADMLRTQIQVAELARKREIEMARLEFEEASGRLKLTLAEGEVAIDRSRQEVRNLIGERALANRLVEQLPELAAHMPEVQELRVLQTGGDGAFDPLPDFLAKMLAVAEHMGISLRREKTGDE